jgi:uncharacterized protein (TIGR00369 family)
MSGAADHGRDVGRYVSADLWETEAGRISGRASQLEHLRGPTGGVRAGALLTLLDFAGGVCGGLASLPDGWVVSTNLAARMPTREHFGPLRIESDVLRRGRNNVVTSARILDEGAADALVADGVLTSAILVPEAGPPVWERPLRISLDHASGERPPMYEWLSARTPDAHTIEIDLSDDLRNPWGILHGGVVATMVDLATEHATGAATTDVVLHFLAPNRTGPVRARAVPLGARSDGEVCRVEVRDEGADRLTALAITTARM